MKKRNERNDYKFKAKKTSETTLLQSVVLSTGVCFKEGSFESGGKRKTKRAAKKVSEPRTS
jgi:hypothetical protein